MQQAILILAIMALAYLGWSLWTVKNKALVYYTRATRQEIKKMVKITDRQVIFDRKRFDLLPERHRLQWHSIFGILGTWVITYHLMWYSRYPEDPAVYNVPIDSPEVAYEMKQEDRYKSYHHSEGARNVKKGASGGGLFGMSWITIIILVILAAVVVYLFMNFNTMSKNFVVMQKALQDVLNQVANK
jgi:amino acid transporter